MLLSNTSRHTVRRITYIHTYQYSKMPAALEVCAFKTVLDRQASVLQSLHPLPLLGDEHMTLRDVAKKVILSDDPYEKARYTTAAYHYYTKDIIDRDGLGCSYNVSEGERPTVDGIELVTGNKMPKAGKGGSVKSRAMIIHGLVHVELAAIDISWDLILRDWKECSILPVQFYIDWLAVAYEECKHYLLLRSRLQEMKDVATDKFYDYGSFPAHDGIWLDCLKTATSLTDRLILEHSTHEARGVDVCSLITIPKLRKSGDMISSDILESIVLPDEVDHVKKGLHYFKYLNCSDIAHNDDEIAIRFRNLQYTVYNGHIKGPFNEKLRNDAGMRPAYYMQDVAISIDTAV